MRSAFVGTTYKTAEFKDRLYTYDYRKYTESVEITLADGTDGALNTELSTITEENLWGGGIEIDDAISSDNTLDVGSAIIRACTITLKNLDGEYSNYQFLKAKVVPTIGLELANGQIATVKMGEYYVEDESFDSTCVKLTCYDAMAKFDKLIGASNLAYPATLNDIIQNACNVCGVPYGSLSLPHGTYTVQAKPDDTSTTFRELIAWSAQINGRNARINTNGVLEFVWYDSDVLDGIISGDDSVDVSHVISSTFGAPSVSLNDITVTQVNVNQKVKDAETGDESIVQYTKGVSGYTISIENNDLVQGYIDNVASGSVISGWLYEQLNGFTYRRASFSCLSDPLIEAGDVAKLIDRNGNEYAIIISGSKFKVGSQQTIRSSAAEPERTSVQRTGQATKNYVNSMISLAEERAARANSINTVMETISADYATIATLNAANARITNLAGEYASFADTTTNTLTAHTASIGALQTGKADITALNAANANITNLNATLATVTTLLNGNQATENLQAVILTSDVATIDWAIIQDLIAQHISAIEFDAQDVDAVKINTDNIVIGDTDGAFQISENTLQITDENGIVRIQMGRDANDDYTFEIFDSTGIGVLIDASGIKDGAVANELIVDRMVKAIDNNYTGISGNKLNINSVVSRLNDDGTDSILATKVFVDEENQSAALVFSDIRDGLNNNTTAVSVMNGKIDKLISSSEIEDIPSGQTMYSQMHHIEETVSGYSETISALESTINGDGEIEGLVSRIATVSNNLDGFQNTVSRTYVTKTEIQTPNLVKESDLASRNKALKGINYEYEGDGWWHIYGTVIGDSAGAIELYGVDSTGNLVTTDSDLCVLVETNVSPLLSGTDSQIQIRYAENSSTQTMSNAYINADGGGILVSVDTNDVVVFGGNDVTIDQDGIMHIDATYTGTSGDDSLRFYSYDDCVVLNHDHSVGFRVAAIRHYIGADATGQTIDGRIRIKLEHGEMATGWYPAAEDARYLAITSSGTNLSPFFAYTPLTLTEQGDYWTPQSYSDGTFTFTDRGDGWVRVQCDNSLGISTVRRDPRPKRCNEVRPNADYTILMEFRNNNCVNTSSNSCQAYLVQNSNCQFWGNNCKKVLEGAGSNCTTNLGAQFAPGSSGVYKKRVLKTSEPLNSEHWSVADPTGLIAVSFQALAGCILDIECRISIYEGEYLGAYAPYIDGAASSKIVAVKDEAVAAAEQIVTETLDYGITANDGVIRTYVTNNFVSQTTYNAFANTTVPNTYATQAALSTLQSQVDAMEQTGTNLIINTLNPVATPAADRPKIRGQGANTAGRGDASIADHGIRFTVNSSSMSSTNHWQYIRFGTSVVASADLLGLEAGETYTLSADIKFNLFSGTPDSTKAAVLNVAIYTVNGTDTSFSMRNGTDPDRIIHEFSTSDLTDRRANATGGDAELEERLEYTFTLPANAVKAYIDIRVNDASNSTSAINSWMGLDDYIEARNLKLEKGSTATEWSPAYEDLADIRTYVAEIESNLAAQIDSKIETWFGTVAPTASNAPASSWTTDAIRSEHVGDLYYDRTTGFAYTYTATEVDDAITYGWTQVDSTSGIQTAITNAAAAQATADGKVTTFSTQPQTADAYAEGDIWVNATYPASAPYTYQNDVLVCITPKVAGSAFNINHWRLASKYTDDTAAANALNTAKNYTDSRLTSYTETSALEAYIETKKDKITSLVSDTYLTQATYEAMEIGGRNLLLRTATTSSPTAYNPYIIPTTESLQKREYVLQLWGVTVDSNSTGIKPYWGGGYIAMSSSPIMPDSNGYICVKWTPTDANMLETTASNDWISLYNFPKNHSGANATATKWKLEYGNVATGYTPAPEDVAYDGYDQAKTYTDTNYQQTKSWVEQNSSSITSAVTRIEAIDDDFDALEALVNNSVTELIVGTQTSTTNAWTGVASFDTLTDGKAIIYWLPQNSSDNVTLNLTLSGGSTTGAKNCYFTGTTRLGTQYSAGSQIRMVYRSAASISGGTYEGWWSESYADAESSDHFDRLQYKASVTAQVAISVGQLGVFNSSGNLIPLTTTAFDVTKPILYVGTAYATGAMTQTDNYISWGEPFDLRNTKSGFSGTAGASVYVVGALDGTSFTPDSTVITCTKPTTADGKIYLLLGLMSSETHAVLAPEHPMYKFANGAFKSTDQVAYEAQDVVENLDIGGLNLIRGTSFPSTDYFNLSNITITDKVFVLSNARADAKLIPKTGYLKYGDYKNDQYTLSFEGKVVDDSSGRNNGSLYLYIGVRPESEFGDLFSTSNSKHAFRSVNTTSTNWTLYSITVSVPDDLDRGTSDALIDSNCLNCLIYRFGDYLPFHIRNIKFERGNIATSWQPAPEDAQIYTDSKLTVARSEISQTTDSISLLVQANTNAISSQNATINNHTTAIGNNTTAIAGKMDANVDGSVLVSKINLTPETVSIDANKINLNGAVTANDAFKINKDGTMDATKGGKISNFVFNANEMKRHVLASSIQGLNILQNSDDLSLATNSSWTNGTYRKSGTGDVLVSDPPSLPSELPSSLMCAYITASTAGTQCGFCQDNAVLLDHEVTFSVYVKGAIGDRVDIQPFWKSSDSYRTSFTLESNDWTRLICTAAPQKAYASISIGYVYLVPKTAGSTLLVAAPKLEYGVTPTAYALNEDYPPEQEVGDSVQIGEGVTVGANGISTTEPGSAVSDSIRSVLLNRGAAKFISGNYMEGYISSNVSNESTVGEPGISVFYAHSTNHNATGTKIATFWNNGIDFNKRIYVNPGIEITYSTPFIDFHCNNTTTDFTARIIQNSNGGNLVANPGISNSSDARLKRDIVEMDDVYTDLIDKLEPKEYRFCKNDEDLRLGFIAQGVISALEELGIEDMPIVSGTGEGEDYYALDYTQFIPILVRKCQKQDEEIRELKSETEELKSEIEELKNMVRELVQK